MIDTAYERASAIGKEAVSADWSKVDRKIRSGIRKKGFCPASNISLVAYCIAFLKWIEARTGEFLGYSNLEQTLINELEIDRAVAWLVEWCVAGCGWGQDCEPRAKKVFAEEALTSYLLNAPAIEDAATPAGVSKLALSVLDIKNANGTVVDLGCGAGFFLSRTILENPKASLMGVEIDKTAAAICRMRTIVARSVATGERIGQPARVRVEDAFVEVPLMDKCSRAFSNYPTGIRLDDVRSDSALLARIRKGPEGACGSATSDWAFNRLLIESIREDGRAIGVMTGNAVWGSSSRRARELFIESGWLEGVIALPPKTMSCTNVPPFLVVLSYGNDEVKLLDATEVGPLDDEAVASILESWCGGRPNPDSAVRSAVMTTSELAEGGFDIDPSKLLVPVEDGVRIGDFAEGRKKVRRGVAVADEDLSDERFDGALYVNTTDIVDGKISFPLRSRKPKDGEKSEGLAKPGDVLITRAGFPFRIAVAEGIEGKDVAFCGNVYAISIGDRFYPRYVAAFLESDAGRNALKRASSGSATQILSAESLLDVRIPEIPMERQVSIGNTWRERLDRISEARRSLEEMESALHDGLWGSLS